MYSNSDCKLYCMHNGSYWWLYYSHR
jgi:hypothetical protein